MKIFLKFIIIFLLTLFTQNNAFSYSLNSDSGFYSNISKNISDVNSKMYSIELQNNGGTREKINEMSGLNCLDRDLTELEIYQIVVQENVSILASFLNSNCKNGGEIDNANLYKVNSAIQKLYKDSKDTANSKSEKALIFSSLGIYSDGIEANGPFDLMKDFEEIDKILFIQDETKNEFDSFEEVNLADKIKKLLNNLNKKSGNSSTSSQNNNINSETNLVICSLDGNCDNYTEVQKMLCEINGNCSNEETHGFLTLKNNFACKVDSSGLNTISGKIISASLESKIDKNTNKNQEDNNSSGNQSSQINSNNSSNNLQNPSGLYQKVNDNKQFPCNDFFCIDIKFKTYNFSLIGGGSDDTSIEFLINRSNNHLKKFVNSSLSQAKMTTNNFELNLKDINLTDMFHMGVQINYEPVPILKVDNSTKDSEDKGETKLESQIEKYYKAHGLEYRLRNDLSAFGNIDQNKQATLNSNTTVVTEMGLKQAQLIEQRRVLLNSLDSMQKLIEEKSRFERVNNLELQMKEVERFNSALNIYIVNLEAILKEILKIPVDKSTT